MKTAPSTEPRAAGLIDRRDRSLWLAVAGAFLVLFLVWAALFTAARSARVETVPLATQGGRP